MATYPANLGNLSCSASIDRSELRLTGSGLAWLVEQLNDYSNSSGGASPVQTKTYLVPADPALFGYSAARTVVMIYDSSGATPVTTIRFIDEGTRYS